MSIASELTALQQDITAARAAISAKGGTPTDKGGSSQLAADINTIPSGGGSETVIAPLSITENGTYTAPEGKAYSPVTVNIDTDERMFALIDKSISGTVTSNATVVRASIFQKCTQLEVIRFPEALSVEPSACKDCSALKSAYLPEVSSIEQGAFQQCVSLEHIDVQELKTLGAYVFYRCTSLFTRVFQKLEQIGNYSFGETLLPALDFPSAISIGTYVFRSCLNLEAVIIRTNSVCTLSNINSFTTTPFASGGTGGTLYVPRALVDSYKTATNWSVLFGDNRASGYANNQILAIEDSIYATQYADGTPIEG